MLSELMRRLGLAPSTSRDEQADERIEPLTTVLARHPAVPENIPDDEVDRYLRYHQSNQHGR